MCVRLMWGHFILGAGGWSGTACQAAVLSLDPCPDLLVLLRTSEGSLQLLSRDVRVRQAKTIKCSAHVSRSIAV